MTSKTPQQGAVGQKEFLAFLEGLKLQTLRLRSLKVDAARDFAHSEMQHVQHGEQYAYEVADDGLLRVDAEFEVRLVGARKKKLGQMSLTFSWYYHSEEPISDKVFEIFAPMVRFQTWPHLREVMQSVAARCNWPRLTLPLLVAHKAGDEKRIRKTSED